ncbi:hypothetical protein [Streptomyces sp. NPDC059009]|uniref:hypothetical protein n=1 Tax=Streptomyces sp. NPDC059009 TaxID=3346694 RepID=UPI0036CAF5A7
MTITLTRRQTDATTLAAELAASPMHLTAHTTTAQAAEAIADERLGYGPRHAQDTINWESGAYPDLALARQDAARALVDGLGPDLLQSAVTHALHTARTLTTQQPWADAIAHLGKRIENRKQRTQYRGLLLIHAATRADEDLVAQAQDEHPDLSFPRRAIVATGRLTGCHRARLDDNGRVCCAPWGEPEGWHWELSGISALPEPVSCTGALYLWTPDAHVLDAVLAMRSEAR